MTVNCFAAALCLSWVSNACREFDVERHVCPTRAIMRAACHCWLRHPHSIEVEVQTSEETVAAASLLSPEEALDSRTLDKDNDDDGEALPVPMVNVTHVLDDNNDNNLLSFMEASQIAIPAPRFDDDFIPVIRRSSQARISSNSVRLSQTTVTNDTLALQQAVVQANRKTQEANCRAVAESQEANHRAIERDAKFDKLSKPEDFHWWLKKIMGRLDHEAWDGILDDGKLHTATRKNRTLSNKLAQHLNTCMMATVGDAVGGVDGHAGKGLEMFQAIIDHFIPSAIVNLPSIFREWTSLPWCSAARSPSLRATANVLAKSSQKAAKSLSLSKVSTKVSLTSQKTPSPVVSLSPIVRLCATPPPWLRPSNSMDKTTIAPRTQKSCCSRARRANGATPNNAAACVSSGPLSRAQVDELFANFKCPLHRGDNNHNCCNCFAFGDHGFVISK
jgi:hypothetical protein